MKRTKKLQNIMPIRVFPEMTCRTIIRDTINLFLLPAPALPTGAAHIRGLIRKLHHTSALAWSRFDNMVYFHHVGVTL